MDPLLLVGLGAMFLALVAALVGLLAARERGAVTRTLAAADRGYRVAGTPEGPPAPGPGALLGRAGELGGRLTPAGMFAGLGRRLDRAGNPGWLGMDALLAYKAVLLFVGAAVGLLLALLFAGPFGVVVWVVVGAAAGFFAPDLLVAHLAQERQEEIRRTLPGILETLVVTVEAGLGFEAALAQVVRNGRGPMVGEFARVLHEMRIGRSRVDALREMAARSSVAELKSFASATVQATTLGVPVAGVLRQQAAEMRLRRRQRAEELAQKIPVKILFPMIFCIFPALFVVVLGPGLLRMLDALAP
ncbi:type II secretion system F family protein [Micromonospora mirobrigensis]|uniref:Tight adherence protein C n=1 Tax=Micromonospora mirobrigensis TaxID=262898 RepID=A0A1C5ACC8_9ACTN|nr:type II secretion system F family protein [Micromonospora mirobrigensis]SCF42819.1 tight adherence protein C [Micromonospora mirobrigensis]